MTYNRTLLAFFFLLNILFSLKLWVGIRSFPAIPIYDWLTLGDYIELIFFLLLVFSLLVLVFSTLHRRFIIVFVVLSLVVLALADQMKLQPWVYFFWLVFMPFAIMKSLEKRGSEVLLFIKGVLICLYLWGGIHKLVQGFSFQIFPIILNDLGVSGLVDLDSNFREIGYFIPVFEVCTALFLLIGYTRKIGIVSAILCHLSILLFLAFSKNINTVVIPWNIYLIGLVLILFWRKTTLVRIDNKNQRYSQVLLLVILSIVALCPLTFYLNKWDYYLAFNLYSGQYPRLQIAVDDQYKGFIEGAYGDYIIQNDQLGGGVIIEVNKWALEELNVPVPPEDRIFKQISRSFCKMRLDNEAVYFVVLKPPYEAQNYTSWQYSQLK